MIKDRIRRAINRVLQYEIIAVGYLDRWCLLPLPDGMRTYLHHFVGSDWTRDPHDHPKWQISIGLRGGYIEETPQGIQRFVAPWIRIFPPEYIHRLRVPKSGCWTIVITGRYKREWGFWVDDVWVHWREYLSNHEVADPEKHDRAIRKIPS